jgi:hypothetical protein
MTCSVANGFVLNRISSQDKGPFIPSLYIPIGPKARWWCDLTVCHDIITYFLCVVYLQGFNANQTLFSKQGFNRSECTHQTILSVLRLEAFTTTECNEVFSGDQPCKYAQAYTIQSFRDCLCLQHHDDWVDSPDSPRRPLNTILFMINVSFGFYFNNL